MIEENIEGVLGSIERIEQLYGYSKANNRGIEEVAKYVQEFTEERGNSSNPGEREYVVTDILLAKDLKEFEIPARLQELEDFGTLFDRLLQLDFQPNEIRNVFKATVPSGKTFNDITEESFNKTVRHAVKLKNSDKRLNIGDLRNPHKQFIMQRLKDRE